jgi:hypothetical protein
VTKGHPLDVVEMAVRAGQLSLGENYLQECAAKSLSLDARANKPVHWHLLGHLQRNKAARAAGLFSCVESLDSLELAQQLSHARAGQGRLPVLCEVELTGLPRRTGFQPEELLKEFSTIGGLEGLEVRGLMTVADPASPRAAFAAARGILDRLRAASGLPLATLSMGMSGDFEMAIAEGSTEVRIGSLLFGNRPPRI